MKEDREVRSAGYDLQRLYASEQNHEMVDDSDELPQDDEVRDVGCFWDWRLLDVYQPEASDDEVDPDAVEGVWFDIAVGVQVGPAVDDQNRYKATIVGRFWGPVGGEVPLHQFARLNGVALIFPYLRQCVSDLSEWAPGEAFYLPVVNVVRVMKGIPQDVAEAWGTLQENPELARKLGVSEEELGQE